MNIFDKIRWKFLLLKSGYDPMLVDYYRSEKFEEKIKKINKRYAMPVFFAKKYIDSFNSNRVKMAFYKRLFIKSAKELEKKKDTEVYVKNLFPLGMAYTLISIDSKDENASLKAYYFLVMSLLAAGTLTNYMPYMLMLLKTFPNKFFPYYEMCFNNTLKIKKRQIPDCIFYYLANTLSKISKCEERLNSTKTGLTQEQCNKIVSDIAKSPSFVEELYMECGQKFILKIFEYILTGFMGEHSLP